MKYQKTQYKTSTTLQKTYKKPTKNKEKLGENDKKSAGEMIR